MKFYFSRSPVAHQVFAISMFGILLVGPVSPAAEIGYWRLEGSGTVSSVPDSSGNGLAGSGGGSPLYNADIPAATILDGIGGSVIGANLSSVEFDATNYIDIPYNALLEPTAFTIEFFMKAPAQGSHPGIVTKSNYVGGSGPTSWGLGKESSERPFIRIDSDTSGNKTTVGGDPTDDGFWHHFALTHDPSTGRFSVYRDYTKVAEMDPPGNLHYDGQTGLRIGKMQAGGSFSPYDGLVDEVRFSDTVLDPAQFLAVPSVTLQWGAGGAGGNGTWDASTTANWYPGSGSTDLLWSSPITTTPNEAVFGGSAGTVTIDAAGVTAKSLTFDTAGYTIGGPGKLTLSGPDVVANHDATISAPMAASAGLNKSGSGRLTLSGTEKRFSTPTTVAAGSLRLADASDFVSPVTLSGGNLELAGSTDWELVAPVSGAGSVTKTGTNQVTLSNFNSYDGQTVVSEGTLRLGSGALPTDGLAAWFDASVDVTTNGGDVSAWADRSGNGHDGTLTNGSPTLASNQIGGRPAVQFRKADGDDYLTLAGEFVAKDIYMVWRSANPSDPTKFDYYGGILGAKSGRGSTFITQRNDTTMHSNQYPLAVSRNGSVLPSPFDMSPVDEFMLLKVVVNDNNPGPKLYQIGRIDGYSFSIDVAEILAYDHVLTAAEEDLLGVYLAQKYGLTTSYSGQARNSIPDGSTVAIAGGATFDVNGTSETIGALADYGGSGGIVTNNAAGSPSVLTLTAPSGTNAFSGSIQDGTSPISLIKTGPGTQVLSGASTYSGTTAIAAGTLQLAGGANRLPSTTMLTLGDAVNNTSGTLILGGTAGAADQTVAGLENAGSGTQSIVGGSSSVSSLTIDTSGTHSFTGTIGGSGPNENNLELVKTGAGDQTLSGTLRYTGLTTVDDGLLKLSDVSGFASNISNSATVEFHSTNTWDLGTGRTISGSGTFNKTGSGRVRLKNIVVTASGQINVLEGKLANDNNHCDWSGSTADLFVDSGAIFDMRADSVTVDALTGAGRIENSYGAGGGATDTLTVSSGDFSGNIDGDGDGEHGEDRGKTGLTKVSGGTLILGGANSYAGPTTILDGTLQVDGSIDGGSDVLVTGGQLQGNGSISGEVVVGPDGIVSAGHSPGHLQVGGYDQNGGTMVVDISGYAPGPVAGEPGHDWIEVTGSGTATLSGVLDIRLDNFVPASGSAFAVLTATSVTVDGFLELTESADGLPTGMFWDYRIVPWGSGGQALELFTGVPEPSALALAALAALALAGFRRRRRRA